MDSEKDSSAMEHSEAKTTFHKPTNDAPNRKYRRRTPVNGSSSSDESPKRNRSSNPIRLKEDREVSDKHDKKEDSRDDRGPNRSGRNSDSHRSYSRSSQGYSRHDDYHRSRKHVDEEERHSSRSFSRSSYSDHKERGSDFNRSRDHYRDADKYNRDRAGPDGKHGRHNYDDGTYDRRARNKEHRDEKTDHRRSTRDHRSYEESKGGRDDWSSREESSKHLLKEAHENYFKAGSEKHVNEETKNYEYKDSGERLKDKATDMNESDECTAKRPKLSTLNNADPGIDGSKQGQEPLSKIVLEKVNVSQSAGNVDAAQVAAMKAAELVNKNLFGAGTMTADQKKKLLWGNKKKDIPEESSQRWNTAIFPDQERQEKFNKLMSLRLPWYIWPIVGCERRLQGGAEAEQRPASGGEAEGASNGFGEAIHCRASAKRWTHCWFRTLNTASPCLHLVSEKDLYEISQLRILYIDMLINS